MCVHVHALFVVNEGLDADGAHVQAQQETSFGLFPLFAQLALLVLMLDLMLEFPYLLLEARLFGFEGLYPLLRALMLRHGPDPPTIARIPRQ